MWLYRCLLQPGLIYVAADSTLPIVYLKSHEATVENQSQNWSRSLMGGDYHKNYVFNCDIHNFSYDSEICNCAVPIWRHDIKTCYYDVPLDSNIQLWYWDIQFWYLTFMFQYAILTFNSDTHIQHIFDKHVHVPREYAYLQLVSWKWICLAKIPPLLTCITSFLAVDKFGVFWSPEMYTWHFQASLTETSTSFTAPAIFTFRVKNSKGRKNLPLIVYVFTWCQKSAKFPRTNPNVCVFTVIHSRIAAKTIHVPPVSSTLGAPQLLF